LLKIWKSKLAGHIQKLVEIVIVQNLSGVFFNFSSLQDQENCWKKDQIHNKFWIFEFSLPLSDALLPDPLLTFLMKKLIKQLSKFKHLKCFFKPSRIWIFVNFHLYSFFWELFLPLGKSSGFHMGVL
jgi:hypothetical protein